MCGIITLISPKKISYKNMVDMNNFMTQATSVGNLRGRDSTGVMYFDRSTGTIGHHKLAVDGPIFADMYTSRKILNNCEDNIFTIVHNRKATQGSIVDANAHPFEVGDITLVHNGTLRNHRQLPLGNQYSVDSEAIAAALNFVGVDEAKGILERLNGAYVLFWYDKRDNTLNMARNSERPFALAYLKEEDVLMGASEKKMLEWLADRNDLAISQVWTPAIHTHFKWKVDENAAVDGYTFESYTPNVSRTTTTTTTKQVTTDTNVTKAIKQRDERMKSFEERFDIKRLDRICFEKYDFEAYPGSPDRGMLKGYDESYQFEVIAYNVVRDDIDGHDFFEGQVLHVRNDTGYPEWPTLVVDDLYVLEEEDNKEKKLSVSQGNTFDKSLESEMAELMQEDEDEEQLVPGPGNVLIPRSEYDELTKHGCSNCQADLLHPSEVQWTYNDEPLCPTCEHEINQFWNNLPIMEYMQ